MWCIRNIRWGASALALALLAGCGGGTGNQRDSGSQKTTLSVAAEDADGDTLQYQWRVTGGEIENRNADRTVWTLPAGPGIHFAYVVVSDGRGGYVEQQYVVASDALEIPAAARAPVSHSAPAVTEVQGAAQRLRFIAPGTQNFATPAGGAKAQRLVYLPGVSVQVRRGAGGEVVHSGVTDLGGEISLPQLAAGQTYDIRCARTAEAQLETCAEIVAGTQASRQTLTPPVGPAQNLRLFGHVALADGGVCGAQNEFFGLQSAATVQLRGADGTPLTPRLRVNHFGDYAIDAAVPLRASLRLHLACEGYERTLDVPAPGAAGYVSTQPVELSHQVGNQRPRIARMVANGPEGSVRGRMVLPEADWASNGLPGTSRFLAYKGNDTRLSACMYYRALGAVAGCDAQGRMINPISLDDWKRKHRLSPYQNGNSEVAANYINRMDLNLVRRMVGTSNGPDSIAFVVCNHPGPDGRSQREVDDVMATALEDKRLAACVAMEWTTSPGVNGGRPFTKFLTFGPDGALLPSINLDGRGEKYMPGACVACHGGSTYNGRFPTAGNPSPYLGAGFLPFDAANYDFSTKPGLSEAEQSAAIHRLNQLVRATEPLHAATSTPTTRLIDGWYAQGGVTLNRNYVPPAWQAEEARTPGAARFYREVVGASCRTCHVALGAGFDWDSTVLSPANAGAHVCGGSADIAINASMPNALVSRDRVAEQVRADPGLTQLMRVFFGCDTPLPDPAYPQR